jgi:hypothetical protein
MINSLRQQDGSSESLHPLRSDKLAYLPSDVYYTLSLPSWQSIILSEGALVPSLNPD